MLNKKNNLKKPKGQTIKSLSEDRQDHWQKNRRQTESLTKEQKRQDHLQRNRRDRITGKVTEDRQDHWKKNRNGIQTLLKLEK